jgi:hypothetical protein
VHNGAPGVGELGREEEVEVEVDIVILFASGFNFELAVDLEISAECRKSFHDTNFGGEGLGAKNYTHDCWLRTRNGLS